MPLFLHFWFLLVFGASVEHALLRVVPGKWALLRCFLFSYLHENNLEEWQCRNWGWQKGASAARFSFFFYHGMWMGFNLITGCSSQLVLISLSLTAHSCFHRPFRLQSNITARDQSPINQMLEGYSITLGSFHAPLTPFSGGSNIFHFRTVWNIGLLKPAHSPDRRQWELNLNKSVFP